MSILNSIYTTMNWPIWTFQAQTPPAKFVFDDEDRRGYAVDSMVSGGCIISGSEVRHSLLFSNVRVNSFCKVTDSVILPDVNIGRHCRITKAIIDKSCQIPAEHCHWRKHGRRRQAFLRQPRRRGAGDPRCLGQPLHFVR